MRQRSVATLMTVAAVAIALALPSALVVALDNVKTLGGDWQRSAAASLFLDAEIDEAAARQLRARISARSEIASVVLISRAEGLAEFRAYSGLGDALDQLRENPLPVVLEVQLAPEVLEPGQLKPLLSALEGLPEVGFVRADAEWAQRLQAILALLRDAAALLSLVLGLGVVLVIGNTIRLEIENRREEIRILALVGATAGFARRPFLYSGAWYGLFGGATAWLLVTALVALLDTQARTLASLYHRPFELSGLSVSEGLILLAASTLLGILGSWIAASRQQDQP
jgi:cell division transport system permease protein